MFKMSSFTDLVRKGWPHCLGKLDLGAKNQLGLDGLKLVMNDPDAKQLLREEATVTLQS
jgi:hypothetical protein